MYKCDNCGSVFDDPETTEEDTGGYETGVGYYPYFETFCSCPECGSDEFSEAEECEICGEYETVEGMTWDDDGNKICLKCAERIMVYD